MLAFVTQVGKLSTDLGRLQVKPVPRSLGETLNTVERLSTLVFERTKGRGPKVTERCLTAPNPPSSFPIPEEYDWPKEHGQDSYRYLGGLSFSPTG